MSGQQSIIDKIILEAQQSSKSIVESAQKQADALIDEARKQNDKLNADCLQRAQKQAEDITAQRLKECDLKIRRKALSIRFAALEQAFLRAKNRLLSLSDTEYLNYIAAQISAHANDGDSIIISKSDEHRITKEFLQDICKNTGIGLTLAPQRGTFTGGVIIKGTHWDCNLTFDVNFRFFRDEFEPTVLAMLLGEQANV